LGKGIFGAKNEFGGIAAPGPHSYTYVSGANLVRFGVVWMSCIVLALAKSAGTFLLKRSKEKITRTFKIIN